MAELKPGINPVTITDNKAIDPDGIWLPQGPEADKEAAADWTPQGLEDKSDQVNITKDYDPSDKFSVKDDEYMNKEPKDKMKEDFDKHSLKSDSWDRKEIGAPGDSEFYVEYTFDLDGLEALAADLGVDVEDIKKHALPTDGFDDEAKAAAGVGPDYEEFVFDEDDLTGYLTEAIKLKEAFDPMDELMKELTSDGGMDFETAATYIIETMDDEFDEDEINYLKRKIGYGEDEGISLQQAVELVAEMEADDMDRDDAIIYVAETNDIDQGELEDAIYGGRFDESTQSDIEEDVCKTCEKPQTECTCESMNESGGPAFEGDMEQPTPAQPETAEAIEPTAPDATDAVDTSGEPNLPEYLQYDSEEDLEFSNGLDSISHTHQGPEAHNEMKESARTRLSKDQLLIERFKKAVLQEARGEKGRLMNDYLDQAPNPSFEDFVTYAQQMGIEDIPNKYYFNTLLKKRGGVPGYNAPMAAPVVEKEPFDPSQAPQELNDLIGLYAQASDEDAQVEPSVEQKFESIYSVAYRTAKGRALKKHAFICGSPGIGKTYTVLRAVERGAEEAKQLFAKYRGSIGKSLSAILAFLWTHRENYVILLDDADGFLTGSSDDVINTLKAAMDTDEPLVSTGGPHIRKQVARMTAMEEKIDLGADLIFDTSRLNEYIVAAYDREGNVLVEENLTEEEKIFWDAFSEEAPEINAVENNHKFVENELFGMTENFFDDDDDDEFDEGDDDDGDGEIEDEGASSGPMLPAQFLFGSKIIFVSNMMQSQIPDAINGRCNVKELYLTRPEIMVRLEQIMPQLLKNEEAYTPEELDWAKANVYRWMKAVVMAEDMNAPLTLASGSNVNVQINVPITFRMFNDFVDGWMSLADAKFESSGNDFAKLEKMIALQFISQVIIPTFAGDQRSKGRR